MDYPEWVPREACEYHRELLADPERGVVGRRGGSILSPRVIHDLIFSDPMKRAWQEMAKHSPDPGNGYARRILVAVHEAFVFCKLEDFENYEKRSQRREQYQKISKAAQQLAALMEGSVQYRRFSELLKAVALEAGSWAEFCHKGELLLPNPGIKNARRVYFLRYVRLHFKQEFGRPLYATLATVAQVALSMKIDPRTAREALRNWL